MTTKHPVHGPVSLDRLHQISEILSKASAQSDGGNLGYAMADAVKVINRAIAAFDAEPVAWIAKKKTTGEMELDEPHAKATNPKYWTDAFPVYTTSQAPVVPDEMVNNIDNPYGDEDLIYEQGKIEGWNACRAAMLQAGNSPVTPDGWIPVSERMPDNGGKSRELYLCWGTYFDGDKPDYIPAYFFIHPTNGWSEWEPVEDDCNPKSVIITHWMPLPAAPQQVVKLALEHGMQRYAGAMQKLSEGDK